MLDKTFLLLIGAGKHQTALIQRARLMGYITIAVDMDKKAEGFDYSDYKLVQSAHDAIQILKSLKKKGYYDRICGVLTQGARGCITTVSNVSSELGLSHLNKTSAALSQNKYRLSKLFNSKFILHNYDYLASVPESIRYPFVIKWEGSSGGLGVHFISNAQQLKQLKNTYPEKKVFVEKFMDGRHFGVMGLVKKDKVKFYGIAEKFHKIDLRLDKVIFPADISKEIENQIIKYTLKILKSMNFDFGPFQLEVIYDKDKNIFFVEIEPSVLGSYISELMIPQTSNNDIIKDSINLVCNGKLNFNRSPSFQSSILKYHYADSDGYLVTMKQKKIDRRVLFRPYANTGEAVNKNGLYIANSFIVGKSLKYLLAIVEEQDLKVEIKI